MRLFILTTLLIFWVGACTRPSTTISLSANVLIPLDAEMPPEEPLHPIDQMLKDCLADTAHYSTKGMIECESKALQAWKMEMEKQYDALMDSISPGQKALLKQAQQAWEQYLRAEAEFSSGFYLEQDGTMWHMYIVGRQRESYGQRAREIAGYLEGW